MSKYKVGDTVRVKSNLVHKDFDGNTIYYFMNDLYTNNTFPPAMYQYRGRVATVDYSGCEYGLSFDGVHANMFMFTDEMLEDYVDDNEVV